MKKRYSHKLIRATLILPACCLLSLACAIVTGSQPVASPSKGEVTPATAAPLTNPIPTALTIVPAGALPLPPIKGQTYYVAVDEPGADDTNNGLYPTHQGGTDGPWKTIRRAVETMQAGDITYIRGGTYHESNLAFANSGDAEAPIILSNYQDEQVIIDGSGAPEVHAGIIILEGRSHFILQGLIVQNMPWSGFASNDDTTTLYRGITIRTSIFRNNGWTGIELAAVDGFSVENIEAYGNGYDGLHIAGSKDGKLSAANGVVLNSRFHNQLNENGHGLSINQGHDILISDNMAYHNVSHGFDVSDWPKKGEGSYNIILERNISYDNGNAGFSINSDSHHVVYRNNIAYRNGASWANSGTNSGFLCYEGCWHVEWYHNVSVENSDGGFRIEGKPGAYADYADSILIFQNNIAYKNGKPEWEERPALVIEQGDWQITAAYNNWGGEAGLDVPVVGLIEAGKEVIYTSGEINKGLFQTGNISLDPLFVELSVADYHLQAGSAMIDSGVYVGLPFCGVAPDLGAFEFCP